MDHFNDVLMFLDLERLSFFAVYARSESSRISSKNILICVPKMIKMSYGFGSMRVNN